MNARRSLELTGATLATAVALFGSTPNVQAANSLNPNKNTANKLAKKYVKQLGGRILNISREAKGDTGSSSISPSGFAEVEVKIHSGSGQAAGSKGEYTLTAIADEVHGKLDRSDINNVRVKEDSDSIPDGPLFALRLFTPHPNSDARHEGLPGVWYYAQGTAVEDSGDRVFFNGSTDPSRYDTPPSLVLDQSEVHATGQTMNRIINDALNRLPVEPVDPPFGPLQH